MSKRWSTFAAVAVGVIAWGIGWIAIDLTVLQIYPLPPLPEDVTTSALLATRPDAAVALNVFGDLIVLAAVAYWAASKAGRPGRRHRHGHRVPAWDRQLDRAVEFPLDSRRGLCRVTGGRADRGEDGRQDLYLGLNVSKRALPALP